MKSSLLYPVLTKVKNVLKNYFKKFQIKSNKKRETREAQKAVTAKTAKIGTFSGKSDKNYEKK